MALPQTHYRRLSDLGLFSIKTTYRLWSPSDTTFDKHMIVTRAFKRRTVREIRNREQNSYYGRLGMRRGWVRLSYRGSTQKNVSQDNSVVMNFIVRCKNECDPASLSECAKFVEPVLGD